LTPVATGGTKGFAGPAEAYDHHVGRYGVQLAAGLIRAAGIEPGQRVLDVGCGPGPLTKPLAALLGAENVAGIDPSQPFVEACRRRVPGADIRVGTGEELPFAADEFDAVMAQLVVQLMEDRYAGVEEMVRVTRPGGVVAACVWDSRTMPVLRTFWDAALEVGAERALELDDSQRVGYEGPEELGDLWEAHGLAEVSTGEILVHADYEGFDDLFRPFAAGAGHSGACFTSLDEVDQRRVRGDVHRRLGAPEGPFSLTARAWWVRGIAG
jgi:ubiquinone/menaquinone biosynthesis C-methylase UbiE